MSTSLTMNIDMLDSVENWLDEFIRKSSELVVVQFQPLQTEKASLQCVLNSFSFHGLTL